MIYNNSDINKHYYANTIHLKIYHLNSLYQYIFMYHQLQPIEIHLQLHKVALLFNIIIIHNNTQQYTIIYNITLYKYYTILQYYNTT